MNLRKLVFGGVIVLFGFILACGGSGSGSDGGSSTGATQTFSSDTGYFAVTSDELTALNMTLNYKYEGTDRISFLITSATDVSKWMGIGFNSTGVMEGADFKIGGTGTNNETFLADMIK